MAPPPGRQAVSTPARIGAILAIVGGLGMSLITLHAIVYLPLHYHDPLNFGEPLQFGDLLALGSGLVAVAVGIRILTGRPGSATARGVVLALAGTPTLILALLWAFPGASHFSIYPRPFYLGFVYFADLGLVDVGDGAVAMPLVGACLIVIAAAIAVALPPAQASSSPHYR
jgi:hypothetical protein